MEDIEIYRRLTLVFHDVFDDEGIVLSPDLTAGDIAEWDSLQHIRLIASVEKGFGVRFTAAEIETLANVGEFVALIRSKQ